MENCSLPNLKLNPGFPEDKIKENIPHKTSEDLSKQRLDIHKGVSPSYVPYA